MSDELQIGRPGSTSVVTTRLEEQARHCGFLHGELLGCTRALALIDRQVGPLALRGAGVPAAAVAAERDIDAAAVALERSARTSAALARSLELAAFGYGRAEETVARAWQAVGAALGHGIGFFLPALALLALPWAQALGGPLALAYLALPERERSAMRGALPRWLREHRAALSDPVVVELVRVAVMSADDFGAGLARVPFGLSHLFGDEGLGIVGLDTSAAAVASVASRHGALRETRIALDTTAKRRVSSAATGFADRAGRIPTGQSQIRIDRISTSGHPDRFEVYLAGTSDASLVPGADAWDMTSNVSAVAGESAGSYRAAVQAMALAGVTSASAVVFTGYSQGGLVAARLAASGDYRTAGLYTLGAPAGQVRVPKAVPYVALEHTEDLIPATGGTWTTSKPVLVRRSLYDGRVPSGPAVLPAHGLAGYRETARMLDGSDHPRVAQARGELDSSAAREAGAGETVVTSTLYRARRR